MDSFLAWVDESPERMDLVRKYIKSMEQEGALDLLGFGTILDKYSNIFFPAVSTIMTRARYYILIPAIFIEIENSRLFGQDAFDKLNERENLIRRLLYETNSSENGIIGRDAKEKINAYPSDIYWGGIRELGIFRNKKYSKYQYIKSLRNYYHNRDESLSESSKEESSYFEHSWDTDFKFEIKYAKINNLSFNLKKDEAKYLKKKFDNYAEDHTESIMTWMINNLNEIDNIDWDDLRELIIKSRTASEELKTHVSMAYKFRLLAAFLEQIYYFFVCEKKYKADSSQYKETYNQLITLLENEELHKIIKNYDDWLFEAVNGDVSYFKDITEEFIKSEFAVDRIVKNEKVKYLTIKRELNKKKHKARLTYPEQLNAWNSNNIIAGYLDYRLSTGFDIAMDIIRGINA